MNSRSAHRDGQCSIARRRVVVAALLVSLSFIAPPPIPPAAAQTSAQPTCTGGRIPVVGHCECPSETFLRGEKCLGARDLVEKEFGDTLRSATLGRYFWAVMYYLSGFLIIALPAIVASNLLLSDRQRRIAATAAAITAAAVTWLEPGARATAKKQTYFCLKVLDIKKLEPRDKEAKDKPAPTFAEAFEKCLQYSNYEYIRLAPGQPQPKPPEPGPGK